MRIGIVRLEYGCLFVVLALAGAGRAADGSSCITVTRSPARLTEAGCVPCSSNDTARYGSVLPFQIGPGTVAYLVNRTVYPGPTNGLACRNGILEDGADLITAGETEQTAVVARSAAEGGRLVVRSLSGCGFVPYGARISGAPHPQAGTGFLIGNVRIGDMTEPGLELRELRFDGKSVSVGDVDTFTPTHPLPVGSGPWMVVSSGVNAALSDGSDLLLPIIARKRTTNEMAVGVCRWRGQGNTWVPVSFVRVVPVSGPDAFLAMPSLVRDRAGRLVLATRADGLRLWLSADGGETWRLFASVSNQRASGPMTVGRTADGLVFIASGSAENDAETGRLTLWPVFADGRLGDGVIVRDAPAEFGRGTHWCISHPVSAILRSADGCVRSVLGYRIRNSDDRLSAHWRTGAYLEDVKMSGDAVPLWDFEASPGAQEVGRLSSIVDRIENAARYSSLSKWMPAAIAFLQRKDLATIPTGKYDIVPGKCWAYVSVVSLNGLQNEYLYEAHRRFFDIQAPISGPETVGLLPLPKALIDPVNENEDYVLFRARGGERVLMPGEFVILPPPDGCHAPGCSAEGPRKDHRKVIIKILEEK